MSSIQPSLLQLVRECAAESQTDFAARFGLKQAVWSKYESGMVEPTEETMAKVCRETGYAREFFSQPLEDIPVGLVFHRKRSALPAIVRGRIEAEARLRAMDASSLCRLRNVLSNVPDCTGESPEGAARAVRKRWGLGDGPVEDFVAVLDSNGVVVMEFDFGTDLLDGFFLRQPDEGLVFVALNTHPSLPADRRHFTLAHELGHALLHREAFPGKDAEDGANRFAAELLIPEAAAKTELGAKYQFADLRRLKERWKVSMAAILRRSREAGVMSDAQYRSYCVYMAKIGCRKNEPPCGIVRHPSQLVPGLFRQIFPDGNSSEKMAKALRMSEELLAKRYPTLFRKRTP